MSSHSDLRIVVVSGRHRAGWDIRPLDGLEGQSGDVAHELAKPLKALSANVTMRV
jgi:hypothetical protein